MGKPEAALSDFSKACELEPTVAVYHYQKASLLHHHFTRREIKSTHSPIKRALEIVISEVWRDDYSDSILRPREEGYSRLI